MSTRTDQLLNIAKNSKKYSKIRPNYAELASRGIVRTGKKINVVEPKDCNCSTCWILGDKQLPEASEDRKQPNAWTTEQCATEVLEELKLLEEYFSHMALAKKQLERKYVANSRRILN